MENTLKHELLLKFCSDESYRKKLSNPYKSGGFIHATDSCKSLSFPIFGEYDEGEFDLSKFFLVDKEENRTISDLLKTTIIDTKEIRKLLEEFPKGKKEEWKDCEYCDGEGYTECECCEQEVKCKRCRDGRIQLKSNEELEEYSNDECLGIHGVALNPNYVLSIIEVAEAYSYYGILTCTTKKEEWPVQFQIGEAIMLIMPVRSTKLFREYNGQLLHTK